MALTKAQVRAEILTARRSLTQQQHDREAAQLAAHLKALIAPGTVVCAFIPVGSEPGSIAMVDDLVHRGVEVLLPVAREDIDGTPLPIRWGPHTPGAVAKAPFGLREPHPPWLPPEAVGRASVVLVPALAVDRSGARLGRGAGFYDRTLPLADADAWLVAVVRDDEVVDHLPSEPHDVRMTHALTPQKGLVALGPEAGPSGRE
ncbi:MULTISPECIES: 5-formyltetrahydrofolate cyclo-ligase [Mycolicibacterium]|uniref:5-formyltetrahydrofolate cyclo-ligase n=2 Tax=Mycolicibacterium TaxID=1866885 RepID=A1TEK7_MYCVP|nr:MULTISPECIES: 5-formyltetrahydrofolate cyclo-ligase [Mycolicibacterium]ABM15607.1 5-formyltetrahydrofolate cyclo-ligase [Mycolicibacterium vanbaalenii PYR-1]MCV7127534.1 5-formyltetrahydrofolate cyclo-ligase [Mycolicibacterium vanbaalenii PYR-1]MDN4522276.1 5-formyltetrahydrofolate cyclo-ligase [Mycolicibacterium austroafricanum]MDW5615105.1 5-formyltetrahydrofolate cyclo-ligase [Mycolicibacterium sp. D5.8-2]PQP52222.1 5-formyltetrahydrofolate cyclo-ligase [Mycolicibacterium austroafricanum